KDSWRLSTEQRKQFAVWLLKKPIPVKQGDRLIINPGNGMFGSMRVSVSPFGSEDPLEAGGGEALRKALGKRLTPVNGSRPLAVSTYVLSTVGKEERLSQIRSLISEMRLCRHGRTDTMVSVAREQPAITRVLPRGNW